MSKRTFLAFLGKGNYELCTYQYNNKAEKSKYIQIALLKIFCSDFDENDKIRIFVTEDAKNTHWEPAAGNGLKKEIEALGMKADVKAVDIPDGESETKLWDIFQAVYDEIDENSSIIFDMTHAFRSLPMFGMTVINYAHYLKNTTLEGIYYGAFEAGGKETGEAPIFDLTPAFDLMTWTTAANSFTKYGVTDELCNRILWKEKQIKSANSLADAIKNMEMTLNYMRGNNIVSGDVFNNCRKSINEYKQSESAKNIRPLSQILDKVNEKISNFKPNNTLNFVYAVDWYLEHSMPAEALSMLKEGAITYLLDQNNEDYKDYYLRDILGRALGLGMGSRKNNPNNKNKPKEINYDSVAYSRNKPKPGDKDYEEKLKQYNDTLEKYKNTVNSIISNEQTVKLGEVIGKINTYRNDIDHCGFQGNKTTDTFDKKIKEAFEQILDIFGIEKNFADKQKPDIQPEKAEKTASETIRPASEPSGKSGLPANTGKNEIQKVAKQSRGCAVVLFVIAAALGLSVFSIAMFL